MDREILDAWDAGIDFFIYNAPAASVTDPRSSHLEHNSDALVLALRSL